MSVKATYSEIMQRIMRRYLFKMDREKVERAKRDDAGAQLGRAGEGGGVRGLRLGRHKGR